MYTKKLLCVLDFDGFLINSYQLLQATFASFGLDIGDAERFRHRRKFLKYLGGGKEFLGNLVRYSLPKQRKIRSSLTDIYQGEGRIYREFIPVVNAMIADPDVHAGIISRNFTLHPGMTIRKVLRNSGVAEQDLDFVIPLEVGVKKNAVLEGMRSDRFLRCIFGGDEVGDFRAANDIGYDTILMASYGFDDRIRLVANGLVPGRLIFDTPEALASRLAGVTCPHKYALPVPVSESRRAFPGRMLGRTALS